jgi:hypothetical protein
MRHNQQPTCHLERLVLRTDGFASLNGPFAGGEMVTKPLRFEGEELVINYATGAAGHVGIEIEDVSGVPIQGYTMRECDPIVGDEIERVVSWGGRATVSGLARSPIRMRMALKDADVYSFRFR